MDNLNGHVMNLANSIIGVSVLAMPYCFKLCGIILSILLLVASSIISRLACHFLLKSAIVARRRTFEFLAFHIFGSMGKLAIEIGIIGFLLGTCIAFFVVMGDLGPEIIAEITGTHTTSTMRTSILMALALFGVLPLGLLRNVDSLNGVSRATIGFYCCLVLKVVFEAAPHIFNDDWYHKVNWWRPQGISQCLPIFSMALFCQTQLFEIYQAVQNATLEKMNSLVCTAVNICTGVYILVGTFGYIAFVSKPFTGNILLSFSPSLMTDIMKIGFILSVAFSFPLVIFPCRASLYSLFYKEGYSVHEGASNYIPEGKFKGITMFIVFISLIVGIMIPNIELVLGLVGSTIGVVICVLFPVTCFICISAKNTNERILAQFMLMVGIFVMVLGTYKNLYGVSNLDPTVATFKAINKLDSAPAIPLLNIDTLPSTVKIEIKTEILKSKATESNDIKEIRREPPQPIEPSEEEIKEMKKMEERIVTLLPKAEEKKIIEKSQNDTKNEEVDIEAIKKEVKEEELQAKEKTKEDNTNQALIDTIQKQNEVQKEIVEQQKRLIEVIKSQQKNVEVENTNKVKEEKLKAVKEIESIALKAIEKISGGGDSEKLLKDFEKNVQQNLNIQKNESIGEDMKKKVNLNTGEKPLNQSQGTKEEKTGLKSNDLQNKNIPQHVEVDKNKVVSINLAKEPENNQNSDSVPNIHIVGDKVPRTPKEEIVQSNINISGQVKNITSNNVNSSAPLFLKLGKSEVKITEEPQPQKLVPLPIAMSKTLKSSVPENASKHESILVDNKDEKNQILDNNQEVQAMRREILSLSSK